MTRSKTTERTYGLEFKMAAALDVVRGEETLSRVASEHGVAPVVLAILTLRPA